MPPKRPPPLPRSLFVSDGPLAPGSAPLPPSPNKIHPEYIVDAHSFVDHTNPVTTPDSIFSALPASFPRPPVKSAVQVKMDVSAEPAQAVLGVKPFSIHPTVLNLTLSMPPSVTNIAKKAVDIIIPCTRPLSEREWDLLDEAVDALDESYSPGTSDQEKILISGLLPPPLTKPSSPLLNDEVYGLHLARLAQLSLHANVYLKALPPTVESGGEKWWENRSELEQVLRMYVSPAIETFGTHRIIFGSFPALPIADLVNGREEAVSLEQPISTDEWYAVLRKVISELGEDGEAMTGVMGRNAAEVYDL